MVSDPIEALERLRTKSLKETLSFKYQQYFVQVSVLILWRLFLSYVLTRDEGRTILDDALKNFRASVLNSIEQGHREFSSLNKSDMTAALDELIADLDGELRPFVAVEEPDDGE